MISIPIVIGTFIGSLIGFVVYRLYKSFVEVYCEEVRCK